MALKKFKDIKMPEIHIQGIDRSFNLVNIDIRDNWSDQMTITHLGDVVYIINPERLRVERYTCKRQISWNKILAVKTNIDDGLLPTTYGPLISFYNKNVKTSNKKFIHYDHNRSRSGNVFTTLEEANAALEEYLQNKTFNTIPLQSPIYMVDKYERTIKKYTLTDRVTERLYDYGGLNYDRITLTLDNEHDGTSYVRLVTSAYETKASNAKECLGFITSLGYFKGHNITLFTDKNEAVKYFEKINQIYKIKNIISSPKANISKNKNHELKLRDSENNVLKYGDNVSFLDKDVQCKGVVCGETARRIFVLEDSGTVRKVQVNNLLKMS